MHYRNSHCKTIRRSLSKVRCSLHLTVIVVFAASLFAKSARAAPLTFGFETVVSSTIGPPFGGPTDVLLPLPFTLHEGDSISGSFTFGPAIGSGDYPQAGTLQFTINGQQLLMSPFEIDVANNGVGIIDLPGRIADPARTPAVDRATFLADRIKAGSPQANMYSGIVAGNDEFRFATQLIFEDDVNLQLLTTSNLPAEIDLWNAFRNRELRIGFNNGQYVGAYIPAVLEIPESGTGILLIEFLAFFAILRRKFSSAQA